MQQFTCEKIASYLTVTDKSIWYGDVQMQFDYEENWCYNRMDGNISFVINMLQNQCATFQTKQFNIFDISLFRISYDVNKILWELAKIRCWQEGVVSGGTHYDHLSFFVKGTSHKNRALFTMAGRFPNQGPRLLINFYVDLLRISNLESDWCTNIIRGLTKK